MYSGSDLQIHDANSFFVRSHPVMRWLACGDFRTTVMYQDFTHETLDWTESTINVILKTG